MKSHILARVVVVPASQSIAEDEPRFARVRALADQVDSFRRSSDVTTISLASRDESLRTVCHSVNQLDQIREAPEQHVLLKWSDGRWDSIVNGEYVAMEGISLPADQKWCLD